MRSFRNPETNVLKAFGYMEANDPGDISQEENEDFALQPGAWQWTGAEWEPCERAGPHLVVWPWDRW